MLFLDTSQPFISPVVGSEQGLFRILAESDGDYVVTHDGMAFGAVAQLGAEVSEAVAFGPPLPLARFESEISRVVEELQSPTCR